MEGRLAFGVCGIWIFADGDRKKGGGNRHLYMRRHELELDGNGPLTSRRSANEASKPAVASELPESACEVGAGGKGGRTI